MNDCDEPVAIAGGTEKRFTAGLEISLSDEPADVMEALETACQAQQVEIGGVWKIRVGGPGLPLQFIADDAGVLQPVFRDDDILMDRDRGLDVFPGLAGTYNGIQALYAFRAQDKYLSLPLSMMLVGQGAGWTAKKAEATLAALNLARAGLRAL
ncbi:MULTISPECIES: hypothetical protein [Asticcacaulis]|uniref:hypothetical protein n=1 Tax=Asticcacaulis TaxID=76890 RepID=UPI001AE8F813|nr:MULTISPECIES: hypothetical protein [Asticcacaulis]MBP2160256.1 hypothetical protein [Asticcacaulis solisilvae]MDR6801441.1 hypothetical protein [Asticcacaulis sp. BE141]